MSEKSPFKEVGLSGHNVTRTKKRKTDRLEMPTTQEFKRLQHEGKCLSSYGI